MPELLDGVIRKGEVREVKMMCTVTDNRVGRLANNEKDRDGYRFVYLADCTGVMSLGMDSTEIGIRKYDVATESCNDTTRCFFNASITGIISWIPSRGNREIPTFFLNKGSIEKVDFHEWTGEQRLMLPTTDICFQMATSKYSSSARFSTTAICGKVDLVCENQVGVLIISLEDSVGYAAVEIHPVQDDETAASLIEKFEIIEGKFILVTGDIDIHHFPSRDNAVLKNHQHGC